MKLVEQIPACFKTLDELRELVKVAQSNGYRICHGLNDIKDNEKIVAVVVDTEDKTVFKSNVTCMACWSAGVRRPLYAKEVEDNFDELCIKRNLELYNAMLEISSKDTKRPIGGLFSLKNNK